MRISLGLSRDEAFLSYDATGEEYRYIDGKLYFWQQPGYGRGSWGQCKDALFYFASRCDNIIYDPDLKEGEVRTSSDGVITLTCNSRSKTVETPAGVFENCIVYRVDYNGKTDGHNFVETAICPGVGIVHESINNENGSYIWKLKNHIIKGGEGIIPFAPGNRWEYEMENRDLIVDAENSYEVTGFNNGSAIVTAFTFARIVGFNKESWLGNMLEATEQYSPYDDKRDEHLTDVRESYVKAAELASTKRQKVHTKIAAEVMERILLTDPEFNPDYTEKGKWNFFEIYSLDYGEGKTYLRTSDYSLSFEWKDMGNRGKNEDGWKIFYNFLYDILQDAAGCVWSDKWIPGYTEVRDFTNYNSKLHLDFKVLDDERVETPVGTFENCRHIAYVLDGLAPGWGYRGGHMEYWFAPGVGIVKFRRPVNDENDNIWILTKYEGKGEGYFPAGDGFVRRYEPTSAGNGWHGSVEYTYDEDESGMVIFRNALGTQDRANFEADLEK